MRRRASSVEVLEVRTLLTGDDLLEDSVNDPNVTEATQQSNAVVDQYSESLQQQYVDPAQQQLLDSLSQFVAATASSSSSGYGSLDGTPVEGLASQFGVGSTAEASTATGSEAANSEYSQAVSGSGSASTLFDQDADLASTSQGIVTSALGGLSPSSSSDSGSSSNTGDASDSSSGGSSSGDSSSGDSSSGDSSSSGSSSSVGSSGWGSDLPDGIVFEDVHLPLEQFVGDLLQYRPTELTSFSITTVTETFSDETETATAPDDGAQVPEGAAALIGTTVSTRSVQTKLTVTIEQIYVDASNWVVHQSWRKEFTITSTSSLTTPPAATSSEGSAASDSGSSGSSGVPAAAAALSSPPPASAHTLVTTSVQTGTSAFSITLTGGISSNVTFSTTGNITNTTNETWNNGSDPTADFDQSGFNASSSQSKGLNFSLTETLVSLPGGSTGRRFQLGFDGSKNSSMQMDAQYGQFEAEGTVMDKDGNPTTGVGRPMGSPDTGRGKNLPAIIPADPTDSTIIPSDPPPVGGDGSRMESGGGFSLSGSVSTGFHLDGEVTMPDGAAIDEVAITGTTGFYTDINSEASVTDSMSYDSQESSGSTLTGNDQYDYLSLGWSNSASGGSDFHFDMDMDLGDADLPPGTPPTTVTTSGPPAPGSPVVDFEFDKNSQDAGGVWLRYETKTIEILPPSGLNPAATPITKTTKGGISIGLSAAATISTSTTLNGWKPELTIQADGHASVTFVTTSNVLYQYGADNAPPEGYVLLISEKEKYFDSNDTTRAGVTFNLTATVGVTGIAMTGGVTINFTRNVLDHVGCYSHEKTQNLSDPTDVYEYWSKAGTIYRGSVTTTGGTASASSGLTTTVSQSTQNYGENSSTGTPPIPPAPPPQVDVFTQTLDYVQTGLDVAGMVPVIGEGCDLLNAGIHLGRGNLGDAALSIGAMIPFAGAGVTAAKFGRKAFNAVTKNADHLDEVADSTKFIKQACETNCFIAGTQVVVAVVLKTERAGSDSFENAQPTADSEVVLLNAADELDLTNSSGERFPIVAESPSKSHGLSVVFVAAGLALAVVRHTWTGSPPPILKSRRRRTRPTIDS